MGLLLICLIAAYVIQGAASQAWHDGSQAARTGSQRARKTWAAKREAVRDGDSRAAKVGMGLLGGLGWLAYGTYAVGRGTGRAVWVGGRDGARKGRQRALRRVARRRIEQRRRERERQQRATDGVSSEPTWSDFLSGRCPGCGHGGRKTPGAVAGCECSNRGWGCACAQSRRPAPDDATPDPTPPAPVTADVPTDPPAAEPAPVEPTTPTTPVDLDHLPDPAPAGPTLTKETPMSIPVVGEVVSTAQTRDQLIRIAGSVSMFFDLAGSAMRDAEQLRAEAAAIQAGLDAGNVDDATLARIASLLEQAQRLDDAAKALAAATEGTSAAATAAATEMRKYIPAEEAVGSLGRNRNGKVVTSELLVGG